MNPDGLDRNGAGHDGAGRDGANRDGKNGSRAAASRTALAEGKGASFTTLVVDGKVPIDEKLKVFLESEGHFILRADSAAEALTMTRRFQPELILLDSQLEGITGVALLPELLMENSTAAVIVMALTPSVSDAVDAMKLGAVDVLELPLDYAKLKRAIDIQKALLRAD